MKKFLNAIGQFIKGYLPIIKLSLWVIILQILLSFFSMVMLSTGEDSKDWVKILSLVMTASCLMILFVIGKSSAYSDFQTYKNNLLRKKRGDEVPLYKIRAQYRPYNGLIAALIGNSISIIFIIIGVIQSPFADQSNAFGKIALILNFIYAVPVLNFGGSNNLFILFYGIILSILMMGAGYYLDGTKLRLQFEKLQQRTAK